jgi:hypothetical protein
MFEKLKTRKKKKVTGNYSFVNRTKLEKFDYGRILISISFQIFITILNISQTI